MRCKEIEMSNVITYGTFDLCATGSNPIVFVAFPRERKSSPQEVFVGGLKLFALRHLKAFRK